MTELVSKSVARRLIGVSLSTLNRLIASKQLDARKRGSAKQAGVDITLESVMAFMSGESPAGQEDNPSATEGALTSVLRLELGSRFGVCCLGLGGIAQRLTFTVADLSSARLLLTVAGDQDIKAFELPHEDTVNEGDEDFPQPPAEACCDVADNGINGLGESEPLASDADLSSAQAESQ